MTSGGNRWSNKRLPRRILLNTHARTQFKYSTALVSTLIPTHSNSQELSSKLVNHLQTNERLNTVRSTFDEYTQYSLSFLLSRHLKPNYLKYSAQFSQYDTITVRANTNGQKQRTIRIDQKCNSSKPVQLYRT